MIGNEAKEQKRELTEAEAEELAEIRDNVRRIMKTLELKGEFDKMEGNALEKGGLPKDEERKCGDEEKTRSLEEEKAFENYIRGVVTNERATNLTPASNSGGVLIPTTIANRIIKKVKINATVAYKTTKNVIGAGIEITVDDE